MRLIDDWRRVLRRAWSVRLLVVAGLLSGLEVALSLWGGGSIPPGIFAALSGFVTAAAFAARLIAQKGISDADQ